VPKITDRLDQFFVSSLKTDFGWMRPISDGNSLVKLDWNQTGWHEPDRPDHVSRETKSQLKAFFKGHLRQFTLPLAPTGKDPIGQRWLNAMANIPYGTVMSYAEFAGSVGKPRAARAAGSICASNPIPIIYPCHRVICTNGNLGNYGGGSHFHPKHPDNLARKAALIRFEICHVTQTSKSG
jgi:methylated-DNA-[protein]-cysteine S-methyltransferase